MMFNTTRSHWIALAIVAVALTGCATDETSAPAEQAPPLAEGTAAELPQGHPPLTTEPSMQLPAVSPDAGTGASGLTWTAPASWQEETPSSSMRRAQYRVPGTDGDGLCVVFYFGAGQGGDIESNVNRWADEFGQPDGRSSRDLIERRDIDADGVPVTIVELTGLHSGGMSPMAGGGQKKEGQMLLGAIASGPDANWFFKCTGPEATMRAESEAFEGMMRSIRSGAGS